MSSEGHGIDARQLMPRVRRLPVRSYCLTTACTRRPDTLPPMNSNFGARVMPDVGRLPCRGDEHRDKRSGAMNNLEHLFLVGEFPERARLLSGLSLELVTLRPDGASHSIYEELWHLVGYQQSIIEPGEPAGEFYPSAAPEHEHQWHDLVRVFLDGARAAAGVRRVT